MGLVQDETHSQSLKRRRERSEDKSELSTD